MPVGLLISHVLQLVASGYLVRLCRGHARSHKWYQIDEVTRHEPLGMESGKQKNRGLTRTDIDQTQMEQSKAR